MDKEDEEMNEYDLDSKESDDDDEKFTRCLYRMGEKHSDIIFKNNSTRFFFILNITKVKI